MIRPGARSDDGGFGLIEAVVAIAVIAVVAASATAFAVGSLRVDTGQEGKQAAVQVALDGMERARTLRGEALVSGRSACGSSCPAAVTGAASYLSGTQRWDGPSGDGVVPALALPSAGQVVTLDGVGYRRYYYVGKCWAPRGGGSCTANPANPLLLYRVVVAVTWPSVRCSTGTCAYVTAALFGGDLVDPLFT